MHVLQEWEVQMVQTFTALISIILGDADSACLSVTVGLTCKGEGEGECGGGHPILGGGISGGWAHPLVVAP